MNKTIAVAAMSAFAAFAEIVPENRCLFHVRTTNDVLQIANIPGWTRGHTTNGFTTTVFVGNVTDGFMINNPVARTLTFDADGRLVSASPIAFIAICRETKPFKDTMLDLLAENAKMLRPQTQRTPGRSTRRLPSSKPSVGGK